MASHAGRWTSKRMTKLNIVLDEFNSVLLVPIYKIDHINISIIGVCNNNSYNNKIIQIARTSHVKPETNNPKKLPNNKKEGVFSLKAYDEDMMYGMGALLSALGFVVYYPKMVEYEKDIKKDKILYSGGTKVSFLFRQSEKYKIEFLEFIPNSNFAENKIVSTNLSHALEFCQIKKQPEFTL